MKVAAYIRVSTDGQCGDDKFGLESQTKQITEYCKNHDMEIIRWFKDEGESGAKERPGFDEIIYGDISNPPYEAVIVAKSDRVARDINVYYYYKMMLKKKDISLISIAEDFGQFGVFASMLEAFTLCVAEMERENINKRTSGGRRIKANKGGYSGGRPPFGYKPVDGKLVVNEEEAPMVKRVFELRDHHHLALRDIAFTLTKEGYHGRSGGDVSFSTVDNIVKNRKTYEGYYKYGDGDWVIGEHIAILDTAN